MDAWWLLWLVGGLALGGLATVVMFVTGSYLLAMLLTRGEFGWPGIRYFFSEALWMGLAHVLLPWGWLRPQVLEPSAEPATGASTADAAGERAQPPPRPLVMVHGYTQNRMNFLWLSWWLRRRGHGPCFGFDYNSFRSNEHSAKRLQRFVQRVMETTGTQEVDVLCHSMGGLVTRTYVEQLGGDAHVRRVITLGTPHRGLVHARLGPGTSCAEMQPHHGFMCRLQQAARPANVRYHSIYSLHDNIVFPGNRSSLHDRGEDVIVSKAGHFTILFSVEVAEHVHRALRDADDGQSGRVADGVRQAVPRALPAS